MMESLVDIVRWLEAAPDGVMVPAQVVLALLRDAKPGPATVSEEAGARLTPSTWQERLWTMPADARLAAGDVAEALQRPRSWVYRHTSPASGLPLLPHRKLDGELVFLAGEVRDWIREHETVVVAAAKVMPIDRPRRSQRA